MKTHHPKAETRGIVRAYEIAAVVHEGQLRKSGEEFIAHPVGVATHPRRPGDGPADDHRRLPPRLGRRHLAGAAGDPHDLRRRADRHHRRPHQDRPDQVPQQGAGEGGEPAQDDPGDGQGHAGPDHQAGRPAAQHAHHRVSAARPPGGDGHRDASRSTRRSPTGWACSRSRRSWRTWRSRPCSRRSTPRSSRWSSERQPARESYLKEVIDQVGDKMRDVKIKAEVTGRPKNFYSIYEKMTQRGPGVRRDLRPGGGAGDRRRPEGLLRGGRSHPLAVEAAPRAVQGLHRDAQVQPLPVAAHDGGRARGQAAGDPDPHPADAPHRRAGSRGALGLQGGWRVDRRPGTARPPG